MARKPAKTPFVPVGNCIRVYCDVHEQTHDGEMYRALMKVPTALRAETLRTWAVLGFTAWRTAINGQGLSAAPALGVAANPAAAVAPVTPAAVPGGTINQQREAVALFGDALDVQWPG